MVSTFVMSARCSGRSRRGVLRLLLLAHCLVWSRHIAPLSLLYDALICAAPAVQVDAIKQKNEV